MSDMLQQQAVRIPRARAPDFEVDGEMHADATLSAVAVIGAQGEI